MNNTFVIGLISWFLPGVGHIAQGRWQRGVVIGLLIWAMFIVAVLSGGVYYPGFSFKEGALLYLLNIFAKLGNGLGALIGFLLTSNPPPNVAAWPTFEYGGRFLEVAGLLNYLAALDSVDIHLGRKR